MKILVDADACPVKSIIIKIAKECKIPVLMFVNTSHEIHDDYSEVHKIDQFSDSVDIALINYLSKNDIVVTQDYGVASLALGKKSKVLNQNGLIFTDDNIDILLLERHIGQKIRKSGGRTKGQSKRSKENDVSFEKSLRFIISIM